MNIDFGIAKMHGEGGEVPGMGIVAWLTIVRCSMRMMKKGGSNRRRGRPRECIGIRPKRGWVGLSNLRWMKDGISRCIYLTLMSLSHQISYP